MITAKRFILIALFLIIFAPFLWIQTVLIPVEGASKKDWHPKSFWYYPWGKSVVHKGIDIFAAKGTNIIAPVSGIVIYSDEIAVGGKVVLMLGGQWRLYYFSHLDLREAESGQWLSQNQTLGKVGDSGNARGKPAHLHFSVVSLFPMVWRWDDDRQGWKKMFYLDPSKLFSE